MILKGGEVYKQYKKDFLKGAIFHFKEQLYRRQLHVPRYMCFYICHSFIVFVYIFNMYRCTKFY